MSEFEPLYDRVAASAILARLAAPGLFPTGPAPTGHNVGYDEIPVEPEPGSALTLSQRLYLERFMSPCRADQVVTAAYRISWTDSAGILNTGHHGPSALGPQVPIVAREAVLSLWASLEANERLARDVDDLSDDEFDVLAATTTDTEPMGIFRIGVEAMGRAFAQHALLAHQVGVTDAVTFATVMRDSGLFATVAGTWFWELQASSYRRGMVPATLERGADGRVRYTAETVEVLAAMKHRTIGEARETMRRALDDEGLSVAAAVRKYHTEEDLISKQYALLDAETHPRCLARASVLAMAADAFVARFEELARVTELNRRDRPPFTPGAAAEAEPRFHVPDMNCKHCRVTITAVLESHGIEVADVDLVTKQVIAQFTTVEQREAAFTAIRDSGYTVVA